MKKRLRLDIQYIDSDSYGIWINSIVIQAIQIEQAIRANEIQVIKWLECQISSAELSNIFHLNEKNERLFHTGKLVHVRDHR